MDQSTLSLLRTDDRVELQPDSAARHRGVRFGTVTQIYRKWAWITLDKSGRGIILHHENIYRKVPL